MKRALILGLLVVFFSKIKGQDMGSSTPDFSKTEQKKEKKGGFDPKKLFFGGGLGMGFGGGGGSINVSPLIGYRLTDRLQVGTRLNYFYVWGDIQDDNRVTHSMSESIYAVGVFSRLIVWKGLYLHLEPEYMNSPVYYQVTEGIDLSQPTGRRYSIQSRRETFWNAWVGGGIYQGLNGQSGFFIQLLYNLNDTGRGIYSNPYLSLGFTF